MKKLLTEDRFTVTAFTVSIGVGYIAFALVVHNWVLLGAGVVFISIFAPLMVKHLRQRVARRKPTSPTRIEEFDPHALLALGHMVNAEGYESNMSLAFRVAITYEFDSADPLTAERWLKTFYEAGLVETNARPDVISPHLYRAVPEARALLVAEQARRAAIEQLKDEVRFRLPKIGARSRRSPLAEGPVVPKPNIWIP